MIKTNKTEGKRAGRGENRLKKLDVFKTAEPNEIHSMVLRELVEPVSEPIVIIFENSWS